jgi:hypothetical protein
VAVETVPPLFAAVGCVLVLASTIALLRRRDAAH